MCRWADTFVVWPADRFECAVRARWRTRSCRGISAAKHANSGETRPAGWYHAPGSMEGSVEPLRATAMAVGHVGALPSTPDRGRSRRPHAHTRTHPRACDIRGGGSGGGAGAALSLSVRSGSAPATAIGGGHMLARTCADRRADAANRTARACCDAPGVRGWGWRGLDRTVAHSTGIAGNSFRATFRTGEAVLSADGSRFSRSLEGFARVRRPCRPTSGATTC